MIIVHQEDEAVLIPAFVPIVLMDGSISELDRELIIVAWDKFPMERRFLSGEVLAVAMDNLTDGKILATEGYKDGFALTMFAINPV